MHAESHASCLWWPYRFLHHSVMVMASSELSVACRITPVPLSPTGWSSWGLPSLLCLQWNKGDQDYPWLELGSLYSLELPPGHVSNTEEMQGYWCNMFHQDCSLIFFVWRPTTALSLRTNLAREDAILAIQEDGHRTFESVFVCSKGLELSR